MQSSLLMHSEGYPLTCIMMYRLPQSVPEAWVPIIKMKFSGVEIDLIFAQLMISQVNDDLDLRDNTLLKGLDEASLRSVNGKPFASVVGSL